MAEISQFHLSGHKSTPTRELTVGLEKMMVEEKYAKLPLMKKSPKIATRVELPQEKNLTTPPPPSRPQH
uniref:Uncharacterized protein n=1 Tax=Sphaerodactylus townsendi TaxID=933632 RepID=A0ACB8G329_9SAUR